jgi:hypothetical protein
MLAGASEWTYGRHAELLTGVPNPPELDPTAVACMAPTSRREVGAVEVGDARRRPEVTFCGHLCARDQQMAQADCASMKQSIQKSRLLFRNPPRLEA